MTRTERKQASTYADAGWASDAQVEEAVRELVEFGFPRDDAYRALRSGPAFVGELLGEPERFFQHPLVPALGGAQLAEARLRSAHVPAAETTQAEPILFRSTKGAFGCFANFSLHPLHVLGKKYPTSEHFFQAMKFVTTDRPYAEKIREAPTPREAADLGRDPSKPLRSDWDNIKDDVMRLAVLCKFLENADAREALLGTGQTLLVEDAPRDAYWGIGRDVGGGGKNMLGIILGEVREVLRADAPHRAKREELEAEMRQARSHMEEDLIAAELEDSRNRSPAYRQAHRLLACLGLKSEA
jgi:N-glycosidase YbiA